ncbi:unnamed protein product [Cladocopium goreaui]|uniref:Uncharacterized protein n=1 Tax=Cladocopium goreaui TaxID=2562237 RepID=A0A9P1GA56_9DINO|nr:unnamed protein product [Cladocopium goreaui]
MCVLCEVCDGMVSPPFRMFLQPGKIEDDVIRCRKGSLTDAGIHPSNKVARMQNRPDFELMRSSLRAPEVVLRINFLDLRLQSLGTPWREGSPLASRPAKCGVCFSRNRLSRGQRISGTAAKPHGGLTPRGSIVMPHPPPHRPSPKLPLCNSCEAPSERIEIQHGFQDGDRRPDPPLTTHLWWLPWLGLDFPRQNHGFAGDLDRTGWRSLWCWRSIIILVLFLLSFKGSKTGRLK